MQDFAGKTAVVTGGASGIGLGMTRALAARGMNLVVGDLDEAAMAGVAMIAGKAVEDSWQGVQSFT